MRSAGIRLLLAGTVTTAFALGCAAQTAAARATPVAGVEPGNCAGCHHEQKVLPEGHVETKGLVYKDCQQCHTGGDGNPPVLETRLPLWHMHGLRGIGCQQCHDTLRTKAAPIYTCMQCHSDLKALAARTADVKPHNPHQSRHYGVEADCTLCHHQHRPSENHCAQCHNFNFRVP